MQILDKERLFGEHMFVVQVFGHGIMLSNICSIATKKGFFILPDNNLSPPAVPNGWGSSTKDILYLGFISSKKALRILLL